MGCGKVRGTYTLEVYVNHKKCAVCSAPFVPKPDTFETRQLCVKCREVWAERDARDTGYRKDA
jgi:hypothetical protein